MGELFSQESFACGNKLFWANFWGMVYMGTNDQIIQREKLMVIGLKGRVKLVFSLIDPDLGY